MPISCRAARMTARGRAWAAGMPVSIASPVNLVATPMSNSASATRPTSKRWARSECPGPSVADLAQSRRAPYGSRSCASFMPVHGCVLLRHVVPQRSGSPFPARPLLVLTNDGLGHRGTFELGSPRPGTHTLTLVHVRHEVLPSPPWIAPAFPVRALNNIEPLAYGKHITTELMRSTPGRVRPLRSSSRRLATTFEHHTCDNSDITLAVRMVAQTRCMSPETQAVRGGRRAASSRARRSARNPDGVGWPTTRKGP